MPQKKPRRMSVSWKEHMALREKYERELQELREQASASMAANIELRNTAVSQAAQLGEKDKELTELREVMREKCSAGKHSIVGPSFGACPQCEVGALSRRMTKLKMPVSAVVRGIVRALKKSAIMRPSHVTEDEPYVEVLRVVLERSKGTLELANEDSFWDD